MSLPTSAEDNFANAWPAITYYTKVKVRVAVLDERVDVKSGRLGNYYVGVVRSAYGIPIRVSTLNATPLANDLEKAISSGFENAGVDSSIADVATKDGRKANGPDEKLLIITLSEWVFDSYRNSVGFSHKATADVFDHEGSKIASVTSEGTKTFQSPMEGCRDALTEILSNKEIVASLSHRATEASGKK